MKARVFDRITDAGRFRAALDAAAGLPSVHAEGEYTITPGNAAARIRAQGVRTQHVAEVIPNGAATRWCVPVAASDLAGVEVELDAWRAEGRIVPRR